MNMQALKLSVEIHNNRIATELPIALPDGTAEVIVLYDAPAINHRPASEQTLLDFFAQMDQRPLRQPMTREEVDSYLATERSSWGD